MYFLIKTWFHLEHEISGEKTMYLDYVKYIKVKPHLNI